jgi:hypothetical protein
MFFTVFRSMLNGCIAILNLPLTFGSITLSLWVVLLGSIVISIVARLIWGVLE